MALPDLPQETVTTWAAALSRDLGDDPASETQQQRDARSQLICDAWDLLGGYLDPATLDRVPATVQQLATVTVARELWQRSTSPGGVLAAFGDGNPVRLARDPLTPAYPLLARFIGGGFA